MALENELSNYRYVILPARPGGSFPQRALYNQAYLFWKAYWQRTFRLKAPTFWNPNDFFRQDYIFCLLHDDEIVAQNLSTVAQYHHAITFDLPYFHAYRGEAEEMIKREGAQSLMTVEYTSVNPNFGERKTGLRFAEIMNGLAVEVFTSLGHDATFAMPRRLSGLSEVAAGYGYRKVSEGYMKAGWNLDVFLGFKEEVKKHPDPVYANVISQLWDNRIDYSQPTMPRSKSGGYALSREFTVAANIREQYQQSMEDFCARFDQLDWDDRRIYGQWLTQAYFLVRHTTRLLSLCAGYCPFEYESTHKRLIEHCDEEKGHEKIAYADLTALGLNVEELTEFEETTNLIQLQYDQMKNLSACSFFGYILLLEGLAVMRAKTLHDKAAGAFGPRTARFLKVHSEDDIEHIEQALKQIESFDPDDQKFAMENLRLSADIYKTMLARIEQSVATATAVTAEQTTDLT